MDENDVTEDDEVILDKETGCISQLNFLLPNEKWMKESCVKLNIKASGVDNKKFPLIKSGLFHRNKGPLKKNIRKIKGDGNCMFRSLSFAVTGSEDH